jgi:phenylacetate-CoA ligase
MNAAGLKELEITVLNLRSVAPNIKYAIGDEGGVISFNDTCSILAGQGYSFEDLKKAMNMPVVIPFPFIYIYGRSDGMVTVNGAMIAPSEISGAIISDPELAASIHSFKLSVESDPDQYIRLFVYLETRKDVIIDPLLGIRCSTAILRGLSASNECFRIAYEKNPGLNQPVISMVPYQTGIFTGDIGKIKQRYLK